MRAWISRCSSISACLLAAACGDGLSGADYYGEPLFSMGGEIHTDEEQLTDAYQHVEVAIFWLGQPGTGELTQRAEVETVFPFRYAMTLYDPPPDEVLFNRVGEQVAIGYPMVYNDAEPPRGEWTAEQVLGGSELYYLLYRPEASVAPTGEEAPAGYTLVSPLECDTHGVKLATAEFMSPVDLVIGGDFLDALVDVDCDESTMEWKELCTGGCGL